MMAVKSLVGICLVLFIQGLTVMGAEVSFSDIKEQVSLSIQQRVLVDYPFLKKGDVDVVFLNKKIVDIPKETQSFTYDISELRSLLGKTIIPIRFTNISGDVLAKVQLMIRTNAQASFLKTKRKIRRGDIIQSDDVDLVKQSLYGKPLNGLHSVDELKGQEARTVISKGVMLTDSMLKKKSVIYSGDGVSVVYKKKNITLQVRGIAKEDGAIGDKIRVKIDSGDRKVLKGVIIDSSTIFIDYSS